MGFVLIVEPEEVNAARIHTILDGVDTDFDYILVDSAEKGIEVMENQKVDVFIADMQMPVMSGTELFSMIEMMSPDTVRIVMTDGGKINETVAFMNECRTFKIIIKPCRVADDLLTPIHAAFHYKKKRELMPSAAAAGTLAELEVCAEFERTWEERLTRYQRIKNIYTEIIDWNLELAAMEPKILERVKRWYQWMSDEYLHLAVCGSGNFEQVVKLLAGTCHEPKYGCTFQMAKKGKFEISAERMNEMAYILRLVTGVCKDLMSVYHISVLLEDSEKAHILRIRYLVEREENGEQLAEHTYRIHNKPLRQALMRATELSVEGFGYKTVVIHKPGEDILNIAIPH